MVKFGALALLLGSIVDSNRVALDTHDTLDTDHEVEAVDAANLNGLSTSDTHDIINQFLNEQIKMETDHEVEATHAANLNGSSLSNTHDLMETDHEVEDIDDADVNSSGSSRRRRFACHPCRAPYDPPPHQNRAANFNWQAQECYHFSNGDNAKVNDWWSPVPKDIVCSVHFQLKHHTTPAQMYFWYWQGPNHLRNSCGCDCCKVPKCGPGCGLPSPR